MKVVCVRNPGGLDHLVALQLPSEHEYVEALGFKLRDRAVSGEGSLRHGVRVSRSDISSYDNIDDVTLPLFEAAANHGGQYDGWECPVET